MTTTDKGIEKTSYHASYWRGVLDFVWKYTTLEENRKIVDRCQFTIPQLFASKKD